MPSTFNAIPLFRNGESFLLRTTSNGVDMAVLVDVGREARPGELTRSLDVFLNGYMPDLKTIDRLILTHEDDDHCGGATQFISNWLHSGRTISQVWLPSLWAPAGVGSPRSGWVRSRIIKGAFQAAPEIIRAMEKLRHQEPERRFRDEEARRDPLDIADWMIALRDAADDGGELSEFFEEQTGKAQQQSDRERMQLEDRDYFDGDLSADHYFFEDAENTSIVDLALSLFERGEVEGGEHNPWSPVHLALKLAGGALDTHSRIAKTIATCMLYDLPIRWFDFGRFEKGRVALGGDPEFLTPVNAVEVKLQPLTVSPKAVFYALALSRPNRECLAYLRHQEGVEPAVLFTGDSRLTTRGNDFPPPKAGLPDKQSRLLATAFHHASNHNEPGYGVLKSWLGEKYPPLFVRNGGHGVKRPAPSFMRMHKKLCVRCIGSSLPDQQIQLEAYGGRWRMPAFPRRCVCK
jgi:hypothetical protein